jgi:hypothetical protein
VEKGYKNYMYGSGDFDQIKNKVRCFVCHTKGHTINRHKEGTKRNPRLRGGAGRNHRWGETDIIEVTDTSNIEKYLICWYVVI